jgi:hypothetical protein
MATPSLPYQGRRNLTMRAGLLGNAVALLHDELERLADLSAIVNR